VEYSSLRRSNTCRLKAYFLIASWDYLWLHTFLSRKFGNFGGPQVSCQIKYCGHGMSRSAMVQNMLFSLSSTHFCCRCSISDNKRINFRFYFFLIISGSRMHLSTKSSANIFIQSADFDIFRSSIWRPPPSLIFALSEFGKFRLDDSLVVELCTKFGWNISHRILTVAAEGMRCWQAESGVGVLVVFSVLTGDRSA